MNVLEAIYEFQLDLLPSEWIDIIYSNDFSGEKEIPDEYTLQVEDKDYAQCMLQLIEALKNWKSDDRESFLSTSSDCPLPESFKKSWQVLISCKVDPKPLLCFINMFLRSDIKELKDDQVINLAFIASRLYVNLLAVPGAIAFNVFNSYLFDQAMGILKLGNILESNFANAGSKSSAGKKGKKPSKTKKKKSNDDEDDEQEENTDSGQNSSSVNFDEIDKKALLEQILLLLQDLRLCLKELHLKEDSNSLVHLAQLLVALTRLETESNIFIKYPPPNTVGQIALKSYYILEQLCAPEHGEVSETILSIMSVILPTVLYNEQNIMMLGRKKSSEKDHTFSFIQKIILEIGEPAYDGVKALIQQMCVRMPDKADLRSKAALDIVKLIQPFPSHVFQDLVLWIISFSHEEIVKYRSCATEVMSKLLNVADKTSDHETENPQVNAENNENMDESWTSEKGLLQKLLVAAILSRCNDVSPIIRAKCLGIFSGFITTNQAQIKKLITDMFRNSSETNEKGFFDFSGFFTQKEGELTLPQDPLPSGKVVMRTIERLTFDDKVHPRKNSLNAVAEVCLHFEEWITKHRIRMLVNGCTDYSVMPRKFMSKSLTDLLLKYPTRTEFVVAWVEGVLPLVADNEVKCQEKIIEYAQRVILDNLVDHSKSSTPLGRIPWLIISEIAHREKRSLFKFICRSWSIQKCVSEKKFEMLKTHIGTENNIPAWYFIVCLSEFHEIPFPSTIYKYYIDNIFGANKIVEHLSLMVMESLYLNWKGLDESDIEDLYSKLQASLLDFSIPLPLISRSLDICYQIDKHRTVDWCEELIDLCEEYIRKRIAPDSTMAINDEAMARHIHTLGDASHFRPGVSNDIINYLANYIAPNYISDENIHAWKGISSGRTRSVSVVALGKICLQDDFLAKTYAPVMASLLSNTKETVGIKINTMIALTDMCVRFTSVVENHLREMCITLKDDNDFVRKNTVQLLTQLIQEDYLKVRSPMIFYLLTSLNDKSPEITELTESLIANRIIKRNGNAMCQFFVQSIYFYNNYQGVGGINKEGYSKIEKEVFCMAGQMKASLRCRIYKFILRFLMDDHRFKISNRLVVDILEEACEGGSIDIRTDMGSDVLKDALFAMTCEEMRFEQLRKDMDEKEPEKETDKRRQNIVLGIARKAVMTAVLKKNYIDTVIPIILKLKRTLEAVNHPLNKDLKDCVREMMKDYKEELKEMLANDPEFAVEVLHDLKNDNPNETIEEEEMEELLEGGFDLHYVRKEFKIMSENVVQDVIANSEVPPNDAMGNSQITVSDTAENSQVTVNGGTENLQIPINNTNENSQVLGNVGDSVSSVVESNLDPSVTNKECAEKSQDTDKESSTSPSSKPLKKRTSRSTSSTPEKPSRKKNKTPLGISPTDGPETGLENSDKSPQPSVSDSKKRRSNEANSSSSQESDSGSNTNNKKSGKKRKSKRRK